MSGIEQRDRNKDGDFKAIEKAGEILQQQLRLDENFPDLHDQFTFRGDANSHRYYPEPYRKFNTTMVEKAQFIPFPPEIAMQNNNVESASFMGILPEINRVWVTVDNMLYLWNYYHPDQPYVYDGINEVIVSVALSAPRPGIFLDSVKYLLVVATPIDISVLAVCSDNNFESIRLSPTSYSVPSDNTTMMKITGSQCGRIFMAGNDSNVYELDYSLSDQSWAGGIFGGNAEGVRKCRKINHFAWNWKLSHVIPPVFRQFIQAEDTFADLAVDNSRNIVYGVTSLGTLNAFYLGVAGDDLKFFLTNFDLLGATKIYLNQYHYSSADGTLKQYFLGEDLVANGFTVVKLFPLSPLESKRVHLVVVLTNGTRIYLSLRGDKRDIYGSTIDLASGPTGVKICGVRGPPASDAMINLKRSDPSSSSASAASVNGADAGYAPGFDPAKKLNVTGAFYSRGVYLVGLEKNPQSDELLTIHEDLMMRGAATTNLPSLREGIALEELNTPSVLAAGESKVFDIAEVPHAYLQPSSSKIINWALHSATPNSDSNLRDVSQHNKIIPLDDGSMSGGGSWLSLGGGSSVVDSKADKAATDFHPLLAYNCLAGTSGRKTASGIDFADLDNTISMSEFIAQHLPITSTFTQRTFVVLTSNGVHLYKKLRPADLILDALRRIDRGDDKRFQAFFSSYGEKQATIMCLALVCGLPADAGDASVGVHPYPQNQSPFMLSDSLANMITNVLMTGTTRAAYRASIASSPFTAGGATAADSRVIAVRSSSDFQKSMMHDALYAFVSRLLRPVWLRPVVEHGKIAATWTKDVIDELQRPLLAVKDLILQSYGAAIVKEGRARVVDYDSQFVTDEIASRSSTATPSDRQLAAQAKAFDEESIRNLYFLVSRSVQLLSLMQIMLSLQSKNNMHYDASSLNDLTFRAITVMSRVQEKVKLTLLALVDTVMSSTNDLSRNAVEALASNCYHFFSAGDKHDLDAKRTLNDIKRLRTMSTEGQTLSSPKMMELIAKCARSFVMASYYWGSSEYVTGEHCELKKACLELLELGDLGREAVVDICLNAAGNFKPEAREKMMRGSGSALSVIEARQSVQWDVNMFHGGSLLTETERMKCYEECYFCLIDIMMTYGSRRTTLGTGVLGSATAGISPDIITANVQKMINLAVTRSDDKTFHALLYNRLLKDKPNHLLQINSRYIEEFLLEKDPLLLYNYFMNAGEGRPAQYQHAANLMYNLATENCDRRIEDRIQFLRQAIASAETLTHIGMDLRLIGGTSSRSSTSSAGAAKESEALLLELRDLLEVAEYQQLVAEKLDADFQRYDFQNKRSSYSGASLKQLEDMEKNVMALQNRCLDISTLFNMCTIYKMWEVCLRLLHASRTNDMNIIVRYWRSFLYRMVPETGSHKEAQELLARKRDGSNIDVDPRYQNREDFVDVDAWLPLFKQQFHDLGAHLDARSNPVHFPVVLLVEELEDIISTVHLIQPGKLPVTYVASCFRDLAVPRGVLVEAYLQVFERSVDKTAEAQTYLLASTLHLLLDWVRDSLRMMDDKDDDMRYCKQTIRSGRMDTWLQLLQRQNMGLLSRALPTHEKALTDRTRDMLEEIVQLVKQANLVAEAGYLR